MNKAHLMLAVLLVALVNSSQARIGETIDQCNARYNRTVTSKTNTAGVIDNTYRTNDIISIVAFKDGKAISITYAKMKDRASDKASAVPLPMSDQELDEFRKSNSGDNWKEMEWAKPDVRRWDTADHQMIALYNKTTHLLDIYTKESLVNARKLIDTEKPGKPKVPANKP